MTKVPANYNLRLSCESLRDVSRSVVLRLRLQCSFKHSAPLIPAVPESSKLLVPALYLFAPASWFLSARGDSEADYTTPGGLLPQ